MDHVPGFGSRPFGTGKKHTQRSTVDPRGVHFSGHGDAIQCSREAGWISSELLSWMDPFRAPTYKLLAYLLAFFFVLGRAALTVTSCVSSMLCREITSHVRRRLGTKSRRGKAWPLRQDLAWPSVCGRQAWPSCRAFLISDLHRPLWS